MILLFLCAVVSVMVVKATENCPVDCTCSRERPQELAIPSAYHQDNMLLVRCYSPPAQRELTLLKNNPLDKIFIIDYTSRFGKLNFPKGLKVKVLFIKNRVKNMEVDALENLHQTLLQLDLSRTNFENTGSLTFLKDLVHLDILVLSNNEHFRGQFGRQFEDVGLWSLRVLKLSGCRITHMIDDALVGLESLEELDLSRNRLTAIPKTLSLLSKLQVLDLSGNQIKNLRGSLFKKNVNLKRLILGSNRELEVSFDAFIGLDHSLTHLELDNTGLRVVPTAALSQLVSLKHLDISNNPMYEMETDCLKGTYCLHELNMKGVVVEIHSSVFSGQTYCIQNISLSATSNGSVPNKALRTLLNLNDLKYGHNKDVTTLQPGAFSGLKATLIHLESLPITHIQQGAFSNTTVPLHLELDGVSLFNINFVMDYPKGTFKLLSVRNTHVSCSCDLVGPIQRLRCALTGECNGKWPYKFLAELSLREKLSSTCPGAPDLTKIGLKCAAIKHLPLSLPVAALIVIILNSFVCNI